MGAANNSYYLSPKIARKMKQDNPTKVGNFEQKLAEKIIKDFGLSPNTLKVWKSRNAIPKKYLQEDARPEKTLSKDQKARLKRAFAVPYFTILNFSVAQTKIVDFNRKKGNLSAGDYNKFIADITNILGLLRRFKSVPNAKNLKAIISDARLKPYVLFKRNKKALDRLQKKQDIKDFEFKELRFEAMQTISELLTLIKK